MTLGRVIRGSSNLDRRLQVGVMRRLRLLKLQGLRSAFRLIPPFPFGATTTGKVMGPDGAPFRAAFVQARNAKTRVTVIVLSGNDGRYRVENLPAGDYQV